MLQSRSVAFYPLKPLSMLFQRHHASILALFAICFLSLLAIGRSDAVYLSTTSSKMWSGKCNENQCVDPLHPCTFPDTLLKNDNGNSQEFCDIYFATGSYGGRQFTWNNALGADASTRFGSFGSGSVGNLSMIINQGDNAVPITIQGGRWTNVLFNMSFDGELEIVSGEFMDCGFTLNSTLLNGSLLLRQVTITSSSCNSSAIFSSGNGTIPSGWGSVFLTSSSNVAVNCPLISKSSSSLTPEFSISNSSVTAFSLVNSPLGIIYNATIDASNVTLLVVTPGSSVYGAMVRSTSIRSSTLVATWIQTYLSSVPSPSDQLKVVSSQIYNVSLNIEQISTLYRSTFTDSPVLLKHPVKISGSTFVKNNLPTAILTVNITASQAMEPMTLENVFVDDALSIPRTAAPMILVNGNVSYPSNLSVSHLQLVGSAVFDGQLTIRDRLSAGSTSPTSPPPHLTTAHPNSLWNFYSISIGAVCFNISSGIFIYEVTKPFEGISWDSSEATASFDGSAVGVLWDSSRAGLAFPHNVYPLIGRTTLSSVPTQPALIRGEFNVSIRLSSSVLSFFIGEELIPSSNECPLPKPYGDFVCSSDGHWVSLTVVQPSLSVPYGSIITILGNLTVKTSITFNGLGSQINVSGCVFIGQDVTVVLTPSELQTLSEEGHFKGTLIQSSNGNNCPESTDLSSIHVSVKTPKTCQRIKTSNRGSKASLLVSFTLDKTRCNLVIIIPSVIGGLILLAIVISITILAVKRPWDIGGGKTMPPRPLTSA
jgi:hypothetical protein